MCSGYIFCSIDIKIVDNIANDIIVQHMKALSSFLLPLLRPLRLIYSVCICMPKRKARLLILILFVSYFLLPRDSNTAG
jgi:hypothetical protein